MHNIVSVACFVLCAMHLSLCMRSRRGLACPSCKALSSTVACFCRAPPVLSASYKTVEAVATMCCSLLPSCIQHTRLVCESLHMAVWRFELVSLACKSFGGLKCTVAQKCPAKVQGCRADGYVCMNVGPYAYVYLRIMSHCVAHCKMLHCISACPAFCWENKEHGHCNGVQTPSVYLGHGQGLVCPKDLAGSFTVDGCSVPSTSLSA